MEHSCQCDEYECAGFLTMTSIAALGAIYDALLDVTHVL